MTVDLKLVIDSELSRLGAKGRGDEDIAPFYNALLADNRFLSMAYTNLAAAAQKYAGLVTMGPVGSEDSLFQLVGTLGVSRPLLEMVYIGYKIGLAAQQARSMEDMFSLSIEENKQEGVVVCKRCSSALNRGGKCTDQTCPYSDHKQDEIWIDEEPTNG